MAINAENYEAVKSLLAPKYNASKMIEESYYTVLQNAAHNRSHKILELLFDKAVINIKEALQGFSTYSAFRNAAENKNPEVMELLLDKGSNAGIDIIKVLEHWDYILFRYAAQYENHEVMRLLFERAKILEMDTKTILANKDYKLFHYAAKNTNPNVIKLLLEHAKMLEIDVRKTVLENSSFQELDNIKSAPLDALLQAAKDVKIKALISKNPALFTAPRYVEYQKIKALIHTIPSFFYDNEKLISALQRIELKDDGLEDEELFAKRYEEILKGDVGYQEIKDVMHTIPSFFHDKERLIIALSHINPKDKKLFATCCKEILAHNNFRDKLKEIVEYKSGNTTAKDLIIDSAYKISVLRDQVGDSLFSKEGKFDEKWLKSGELTKLSLVTRDLMKYAPIKEKNDNSLDGTKKVTTFSSLSKNLKATVLSFLIAPKEAKPESISAILEALRQPLHNALETQEIKAGTYNKLLALLSKEVILTNTSNNLASEEVTMLKMYEEQSDIYNAPLSLFLKAAFEKVDIINTTNNLASEAVTMPKIYEEQSGIYNAPLASLRKALYAKDDTDTNNLISLNVPTLEAPYEQSEQLKELISLRKAKYEKAATKQDKEPPAAPPTPELNKYLLNKELCVMEVSNGLKPKILALSDASQEQNISAINSKAEFAKQNTAYVPSSLPKTLYNVAVGFKVLDTAIDTTRLLYEPTANNATKVIVDSAHIYSAFYGWNWLSVFVTVADGIYSGYIGEYGKVLQNTGMTVAYMGLSYVAMYAPQLTLAYSLLTAGCSAYSLLSNSYSFYEEYSSGDLALKSDAAYADLGWFWDNLLDQSGNDLDVELAAYAENDWQNDLYQSDNGLHVEL